MSWERDPLWAKSRLFFERAFSEPRDSSTFGLWCSLALELLARAAVASVSPTLLAEADNDHKFLLHALNKGSERTPRKSIGTAQVLALCRTLFPKFSEGDSKAALALVNRRNEELHSGGAAFEEYKPRQWLPGFYRACLSLSTALGETLESLFGPEEAKVAADALAEIHNDVTQRVNSDIAAHRKVFQGTTGDEQAAAKKHAEEVGAKLADQRHHKVVCPACRCTGVVQGTPFGKENVTHAEGEIVVRRPVSPSSFACPACGLKLQGYAELDIAQLGGHYTRTTTFSPEDYYGLIDPSNYQPSDSEIEQYLYDHREYDNE